MEFDEGLGAGWVVNNPNQFSQHILYQSIVTVGISGTVSERGHTDLLLEH